MFRCSRCDQRTFSARLERRLRRRKCRWPSRSHVASSWELWEVLDRIAQLERHGKYCCHILLYVPQYSGIHTMVGHHAEICLFIVSDRSVCIPFPFATIICKLTE